MHVLTKKGVFSGIIVPSRSTVHPVARARSKTHTWTFPNNFLWDNLGQAVGQDVPVPRDSVGQ